MSRILVLQFYKDLSYRTDVIGTRSWLGTDTKMLYNSNDYTIRHYIMPFENVKIAKMLMY
jgi:hypothetical protein